MAIKFATTNTPKETPRQKHQRQNAEMRELTLGEPVKRGPGRPASGKETVTLRLDTRTVAFFKTYGDEWREAMSDALDKAAML